MIFTFKALHLIAMVCWFAGLFYVPRLFVYHAAHGKDPKCHKLLSTMTHKLYFYITTPAMVATWLFGLVLVAQNPSYFSGGWLHAKLLLVAVLTLYHASLWAFLVRFKREENTRNHTFFRWYNEVPTLLLVMIVVLAVFRPF